VELHVNLLAFRQIDMVDPHLLTQLETVWRRQAKRAAVARYRR
jgi:hypothetical protein